MKRIRNYAFVAIPNEKHELHVDKALVEILVIEERDGSFYLNGFTQDGKLVANTKHQSIKEAKAQANHKYPQLSIQWKGLEGIRDDIQEILETYKIVKKLHISENTDGADVRVGNHVIYGFVSSEVCPHCKCLLIYEYEFDSYFCPNCNPDYISADII